MPLTLRGTQKAISLAVISGSISRIAGGLFQSVRHSSHALADRGVDVQVYGLCDAYSDADQSEWQPLRPTLVPRARPLSLGLGKGLGHLLDQHRPDVVHQHGLWMGFSHTVDRWSKRHDRPVVISPRGMLDPWALRNSRFKKQLAGVFYEHRNLRGAAVLHALNQSEAQAIRAFGITRPIAVIPNGVTVPDSQERHAPPDFLPQDGRNVLLFLGRLHPKKRVAELMQAWAMLADKNDPATRDWRLVVAGWGEPAYVAELARIQAQAGLGDQIILAGAVHGAAKSALLAHSNAFVLPSLSEGLPMAVLEAWSYRLPVFISEQCNLPEGFESQAAIQIGTEVDCLAKDLRAGLQISNLAEIGSRGHTLVRERFSWTTIARDQHLLYDWCLNGGAPPDFINN